MIISSGVTRNLKLKHDSGMLRLYSMFKNINVPFDMKMPIFININDKLAELIGNYGHSKVLH